MPFDENGFLGRDVWILTEKIRNDHKALFELCYEINRFAEKTKFEFTPRPENCQELISSCLFIRILEGVQAAIILIERGLDTDAQVLIRGVLEALVLLKLSVTDKKFSFEYLNYNDYCRLNLLKQAHKSSKDGVLVAIRKHITKNDIENLEKGLRDKGFDPDKFWKNFRPKKLFKKAGMFELYNSVYYVLSDFAHTNPFALERYVEVDKNGKLCQLNHGPCDDCAKMNLTAAGEFTLSAISAMCELFKIDKEKEINELHRRLCKIS